MLGGENIYSGPTDLLAGTLDIDNETALGTGAFTINGGTTIDNTSGAAIAMSNNNAIHLNGNFTFTGSNSLNLGSGAVTLEISITITVNGSALGSRRRDRRWWSWL